MQRFLLLILPWFLAACATSPFAPTQVPTESGFARTKLFAITAEAETQKAGRPANDATVTAIMGSKYSLGTAMARTMTAAPTDTFTPTFPVPSRLCGSADLKTVSRSMGATGKIMVGAGLTNISTTPCLIQTWPQVRLVDGSGRLLDADYSYYDMHGDAAETGATEQAQVGATATTGLLPGQEAWINLIWDNWCLPPVSGGVYLRLKLMAGAGTIEILSDVQGGGQCGDLPGTRSTIAITPFEYVMATP
jgi:hypothetical protein